MSFSDTIKGLIFKKPAAARPSPEAPEGQGAAPRSGGAENPYLSARRTWNEHVGSVVSSRAAPDFGTARIYPRGR